MFGYVTANWKELTKEQQRRYGAVYCGICRCIREQSSNLSRLGLSYDMAFLALILMSLYEPEEETGPLHCAAHPLRRRNWIDNDYVRYAADMNIALCYYKLLDDWQDDKKLSAKLSRLTGKTIELVNRVDSACIGGVRLDYDGKRVDGSVANRLESIRNLLKNTVL